MTRLSSILALGALSILSLACVAGGGGSSVEDDGSGGSGAGTGGTTSQGGSDGGFAAVGGSGTGGNGELFEVYGHGPNALFKLDPTDNSVSKVGDFINNPTGVLDIAIDKDNNIVGVTRDALWSIDRSTGLATMIADMGDHPDSLGFVPAGTLDANTEALVGYKQDEYLRIDPATGAETVINATALPPGMESSGDIVSVDGGMAGNKTYLTVYDMDQCLDTDCILEIDPVTGNMIQNYGSVGYDQVFGLAFWGGSAYGFTRGGDVFQITFNSNSVSTTPVSLTGLNVDEFFGAGSSTLVPLLPPQ